MKNKKKTLWDSLQHPEPVIFDERMEAIDNRSYIWGFRIYSIIIIIGCLLFPLAYPDSENNIGFFALLVMGIFILFEKTLYRCYYGILEVENKKRSGMYNVVSDCIAIGLCSTYYLYPFRDSISKIWYGVAFFIGFIFYYSLCHITYAQYLKSNDEDFNGRKKEYSQAIGILCAVLLGIYLIGPVVNYAINKDRIVTTLSKQELDALDQIQKASDAYYDLEVYKSECFYSNSGEGNRTVYSNFQPNHSYYWQGSKESFALVLDDNNPNNPVYQANYLEDYESNMEWNIYNEGRWILETDYLENSDIPGDIETKRAYLPFTGTWDIDPETVEDILIEGNEEGYIYKVIFNDKYLTVSERLDDLENNNKRQAIEIYTVNDFGVMIGYELQLTTYNEGSDESKFENMKFKLLNVNKVKIDGEIHDLVNGNFKIYINPAR